MSLSISFANFSDDFITIELKPGSSTFLVGANGSGKTRLAAYAEKILGQRSHRISAHRSLNLNPAVEKISETKARSGLRFGFPDIPENQ